MVALKVSFKSRLYMGFLLSLSANAHKILRVEKNIAIRIDRTMLRLFNISLSMQRIFTIPTENKAGTIKILTSCSGFPLNTLKCSEKMVRTSRKLLIFKEKLKTKKTIPITNKTTDVTFTDFSSCLCDM
jgi:hypothetical protein